MYVLSYIYLLFKSYDYMYINVVFMMIYKKIW